MLTSDYDKHICEKYRTKNKDNELQCKDCPLMIDYKRVICKAVAHYDKTVKKWVSDYE